MRVTLSDTMISFPTVKKRLAKVVTFIYVQIYICPLEHMRAHESMKWIVRDWVHIRADRRMVLNKYPAGS